MNGATEAVEPPLTIGGLLRDRAARLGDQDLFVCDDDRLTYADADHRSRELARAFVGLGARRSTHVGVLMPSSSAFIVSLFAAMRIGAVAVPISTFSTPTELAWLLRNANVSMLIAARRFRSHDYVEALHQALHQTRPALDAAEQPLMLAEAPALRWVFFDDPSTIPAADTVSDELLTAIEDDVRPSDRMSIVHTSGSTSEPKGVIHTHASLIRHAANLNALRGLTQGMKLFSNSPLFWIGGLGYNVVGVLAAGATLITSTTTDAGKTLDLIENEKPQMVNGFAQTVAHLTKHPTFSKRDFSSIRFGNLYPVMPDDVRPADPELRHNMIGMTETGSVCLMSPDESDQPEHRRGSFGKPVTDLQVRVVDPNTGNDSGPGELGELWMRGPLLMEGYYGRERHDVFDADGWFHGGDLFVVDEDGFFYFKGRRGDMIKTAGANVSPREVESVLRDILPDHTSLVLGLPDPERGQVPVAVVIAPPTAEIDEAAVIEALRGRLSHYKVPRRVFHLTEDEVPMLSSGKIDGKRMPEVLRGR